ncbi:MAG: Imm7 family immunity protein [Pseudomonadota bacterium]
MFEIHGWVNLSVFAKDESALEKIGSLNDFLKKTKNDDIKKGLQLINGCYVFYIARLFNHRTQAQLIIKLIYEIPKIFPTSYGLVYYRDDEDKSLVNKFEVIVIEQGKIIKQKDSYLSPCVPIIEDYDEDFI